MNFNLISLRRGKVLMWPRSRPAKVVLIMKSILIFSLLFTLQLQAKVYSQLITLSVKEESLESVFKRLKAQSDYVFFYDQDLLKKAMSINLDVKNKPLRSVLDLCFENQPLTYSVVGKTVIVKAKLNVQDIKTAQTEVRGRVVDAKGEGVPGVTVTEKGTRNGASTDAMGNFVLKNTQDNAVLVLTGVHIDQKEVVVAGRRDLGRVVVQLKMVMGEEVTVEVNTGYQTLSRERATGAYDIVNKDKIEKRIFTNVREVLEGQTTGLNSFKGGTVVRGVSTFSEGIGNEPLLVIDGMPTERSIDDINVNDVESITVLKDAAAASIYGVRAANGVIVIATKGGKMTDKAKTTIQFTSDFKWVQNPSLKDYHYASTKDYMDYELAVIQRDALKTGRTELDDLETKLKGIGQAGTTSNSINYYSPVKMLRLQHLRGEISESAYGEQLAEWSELDYRQEYVDRFWQTPLRQSYNVSLNSSSKNQSTFASLNYIDDGQQNRFNKNKYIKGNIKSTQVLNKWLSFDVGADIQYNNKVNVQNIYANITAVEPYTAILDDKGNKVYRDYVDISGMQGPLHINPKVLDAIEGLPQFESFRFNVLDELKDNLITRNDYKVRSFARFNVRINEDLKFSSAGEYEFGKYKTEDFRSKDSYYYRFLRNRFATNESVNSVIPIGGRMATTESSVNSWVWRNQLDFNKSIGLDHQITATGGLELRQVSTAIPTSSLYYGYDPIALTYTLLNNYDIYTVGYRKSYIYNNNTGLPGAVSDGNGIKIADGAMNPTLSSTLNRYMGLYGAGGYTYKNKYSASGSIRVDQTNLFGTNPKYRYRPLWSAGIKWNMAKEDFMQGIKWVDMLDVRFSYGLTGNVDQTTTPFLVASLGNQSTYTSISYPYTSITSAPNPMLRWEKTTSYNAGVDYSLLKGMLTGKLDFYYKSSEDLLGTKEVHFTSGYATQRVNSGAMSNKGIEVTISSPWYRSQDFQLASTVMLSYNKNTVTKTYFNPTQASHLAIGGYLMNGKPYDAVYAYRYGGLTSGGTEYQNGVPIIYRADGTTMHHFTEDGKLLLDGSTSMNVEDVVYRGTKTPLVHASFTQHVRFKSFELSALFLYYGGHKMYKPSFMFNSPDQNEDWIGQAWAPNNSTSTVPKALIYYQPDINVVNVGSLGGMYIRSDENVVKGDFVRLRNLALSYYLPKEISDKWKMDRIKVTGQINNPWMWSAAGRQYDAEVQGSKSNSSSLSNWGLPTATTYLVRFDIMF